MANVSFKFGTRAKYDELLAHDSNTLYWLLDTQELYRGDVLFGTGAEATDKAAGLLSPEDKANLDRLVKSGITGLTPIDSSVSIDIADGVAKIGVAISKEDGNIINVEDDGLFVSASNIDDAVKYTVERQSESTDGYAVTYKLKKTVGEISEFVGDEINIPKDLVLQSGTFEVAEEVNVPYVGAEAGDPYIDLVLNDPENTHIYIPLKGVVDTVEAGQGIAVENNVVSVKLNENNMNGLALADDGLGLNLATKETAGAMSALDKKFIDAIPTLYDEVKYDFSSLLEGTRISNQGKEYRIMFPADTEWKHQPNNGGDKDNYYFAMRAYAPDNSVVGFKEATKDFIDDPKLYHFVAEDFGGVDEFGRKYSIVWLPAANYDKETDAWTYYGARSGNGKYIGWYYSVEWYDENNKVVSSDTIRINLTNEECHNSTVPFYMNEYAKADEVHELQDSLVWSEM